MKYYIYYQGDMLLLEMTLPLTLRQTFWSQSLIVKASRRSSKNMAFRAQSSIPPNSEGSQETGLLTVFLSSVVVNGSNVYWRQMRKCARAWKSLFVCVSVCLRAQIDLWLLSVTSLLGWVSPKRYTSKTRLTFVELTYHVLIQRKYC